MDTLAAQAYTFADRFVAYWGDVCSMIAEWQKEQIEEWLLSQVDDDEVYVRHRIYLS